MMSVGEIDGETNPQMNRILAPILLLVFLFPTFAFGETMKNLVYRETNNSYYKKFTNVPFTGTVKGQYQGKIKNGNKVGPWVWYKEDGTVLKGPTGTYEDGVRVK